MGTSQENFFHTFHKEMDEAKKKIESMSSARIYRVPKELRKVNESAYIPRLVSIGPLHSKDKHLNSHMQKIKMSCVESFLNEMSKRETEVKEYMLAECVNKMEDLIDDAKHYYAEEVHLDVKMLVTDGCFILEVLRRDYKLRATPDSSSQVTEEGGSSIVDPILDIPVTCEAVLNDLLLLENQLPFFVLQELFDCTLGRTSNSLTLRDYVLSLFRGRLTIGDEYCTDSNATNCGGRLGHCVLSLCEGNNNNDPTPPKKHDCPPYHILHLLHHYYTGDHPPAPEEGPSKKEGNESPKVDMRSASDLARKGVKFESCKNIFEVDFQILGRCCGARFRIPTLYVDDSTEPILRNLIALEQCCPLFKLHFTSYADLMDTLVNTEKDVEELVRDGLLHNFLGNNKEASRFFNNLCKGVTLYPEEDLYSLPRSKAVRYSEHSSYNFLPAIWTHIKCNIRDCPWTSFAFLIAFVSFGIALTKFIRCSYW